jgi:hypothetical protein
MVHAKSVPAGSESLATGGNSLGNTIKSGTLPTTHELMAATLNNYQAEHVWLYVTNK